jgi:hypothetical protein
MLLAHNKNNWSLMIKEAKKANNEYYSIDKEVEEKILNKYLEKFNYTVNV